MKLANPTLYATANNFHVGCANRVFQKYGEGSKGNGNTLDIGCGDGRVTKEVVLKNVGGNIIRVDISKEMIEHAQKKYTDVGLQFRILDIAGKVIPNDLVNKFDRVHSSSCLHWITKIR